MKNRVGIIIVSILVGLFPFYLKGERHLIQIENLYYDFGKIRQGVPITHEVKIKNTSDKKIKLGLLDSNLSCCVMISNFKEELKPQEESIFKITYSNTNYLLMGDVLIDIKFSACAEDGEEEIFTIIITGKIEPGVLFHPTQLYLGEVNLNSIVEKPISLFFR